MAAVLHAETSLNERAGEISRYGDEIKHNSAYDGKPHGAYRLNKPDEKRATESSEDERADESLPRFLGRDGWAEGTRNKTAPDENSAEVGPDIAEFGDDHNRQKDGQAIMRIHIIESQGEEPSRINKGENSGADAAEGRLSALPAVIHAK